MLANISCCSDSSSFTQFKEIHYADSTSSFLPEITEFSLSFDIIITWDFYVYMTGINKILFFVVDIVQLV